MCVGPSGRHSLFHVERQLVSISYSSGTSHHLNLGGPNEDTYARTTHSAIGIVTACGQDALAWLGEEPWRRIEPGPLGIAPIVIEVAQTEHKTSRISVDTTNTNRHIFNSQRGRKVPKPMGRKRSPPPLSNEIFAKPTREMTSLQQAFVDEYLTNGGNAEAAAIKAGYSAKSANSQGYNLLAKPLIQQAISKRLVQQMGLAAVPALDVVTRLMHDARSEYVRLEAAKDILDRGGFKPPDRVQHRVDGTLSVTLNLGFEEPDAEPKVIEGE